MLRTYLVTDDGIKALNADANEEGKVFDPETGDLWPPEYLENTPERAVMKFMAYQKVAELRAGLVREFGQEEARKLVYESERAGAIANPQIAIEMFTRKLNQIAFS